MSAIDFFAGRKVLAEVESSINGKVTVVRELAWGTYIKAGGLPQSGGLAKRIWERSLKKVKRITKIKQPRTVLILGFAGGGIAQIARDNWPESEIYGVDVDPIMVDFGKRYLDWEKTGAKVWIQDAEEFIDYLIAGKKPSGKLHPSSKIQNPKSKIPDRFDLICVDMYVGAGVPEKFNTLKFAKKVSKLLTIDGLAVFNRLFGSSDRGEAAEFKEKLDKVYPDITTVYPEANIMFVCKN